MSHLGLHQYQTKTQRTESLEKVQQHRYRDVVWQVCHKRGRRIWQLGNSQRIGLDQGEGLARRALGDGGL